MKEILKESCNLKFTSTDDLIQSYENKLAQSIALKSFESSKKGLPVNFTEEELAYLNKKVQDNEELSVTTPSPIINIKKGNTEIQISNATEILKKMNERYPLGNVTSSSEPSPKELPQSVKIAIEKEIAQDSIPEFKCNNNSEVKTVNKNAYEIRADVLSMALEWVKFKYSNAIKPFSDDTVLETAAKFYKFVENRK